MPVTGSVSLWQTLPHWSMGQNSEFSPFRRSLRSRGCNGFADIMTSFFVEYLKVSMASFVLFRLHLEVLPRIYWSLSLNTYHLNNTYLNGGGGMSSDKYKPDHIMQIPLPIREYKFMTCRNKGVWDVWVEGYIRRKFYYLSAFIPHQYVHWTADENINNNKFHLITI